MRITSGDVGVIVAVFAFLFGVAGVIGSWRTSRNTTVLAKYREAASAWESYAKARDAEISELQASDKAKDSLIAELAGKVAVLQEAVTGAQAWGVLDQKIGETLALAGENRTEIRAMHEELRKFTAAAA